MQSLSIQDLCLRRGEDFQLGPIELELASGSRTALVGPSGCGKSTLLRCIAGLEKPERGRISIGDKVATDGRALRISPQRRRLGFVFQDGALWPHLSVIGHLRFVAPKAPDSELRELLVQVGLDELADRRPAQLSGGEAQRLALARALVGEPELLLLDEPLASVDVHLRDELAALVRRLAEQRALTLVVVTHDRDEALAMADDIVVMVDGRLVEQGSAADLLAEPRSAFAARFLAHAVLLPIETSNGAHRSAFGELSLPDGARAADFVHAVLPNDVRLAAEPGGETGGRVTQLRPDSFGHRFAVIELGSESGASTLLVPCAEALKVGAEVRLELTRQARVLPSNGGPK